VNRDNHLIYEGYRQKRFLTPRESLQRDKEFFNYVIESNNHLFPLKKLSTKKLFSSYVSTLANRIDSDNPGLIKESNMSDAEAFSVLNEATQTVSDQDAYDAVKDIFEEIAVKQLIRKADLFLEQDVIVTTQGGKKKVGYLTGEPVAQGRTQVTTYGDKKTTAYPNDQIQQIGPDAQQQRKLDGRPATNQRMRGLRSANQELTKANQESTARIAELEAKIQEMEAAEANMNQQQKAQSDAIQAQMMQIIQQLIANQGIGQTSPSSANNAQGTAAAKTEPGTLNKIDNFLQGKSSKPNVDPGVTGGATEPAVSAPEPKKPGIMSRVAGGLKNLAKNPTVHGLIGAGLGNMLLPGVGGAVGGALAKGLSRGIQQKGNLGQKLGAGLAGAATGGLVGAGADALTGAEDMGDMSMPADNASSVLDKPAVPDIGGSPDVGAIDYSDTEDANNPEYMAGDQDPSNVYGAETGTGLPAGGETQEGDDVPAANEYKSVDNTKGAQKLKDLSRQSYQGDRGKPGTWLGRKFGFGKGKGYTG